MDELFMENIRYAGKTRHSENPERGNFSIFSLKKILLQPDNYPGISQDLYQVGNLKSANGKE